MTSWIIVSVLTSVGTVLLLGRVMRWVGAPAPDQMAASLDRLIAIEQRAAAGALSAKQAQAARAEIERSAGGPVRPPNRNGRLAAAALAGTAILGAVAFHAAYGGLDVLDDGRTVAAAARQDDRDGAAAVEALAAATAQSRTQPLAMAQDGPPQRALASVDEMIERLVARLQRNPKDGEGWRLLGWSYFNTERFDAAAEAYAKAIELVPQAADLRSAYGESLVRVAGGSVTDAAAAAFQQALRLDAKDPRARFFGGMRKLQDGDRRAALDDWLAILNAADAEQQPWFADLTQRVTELSRELKVDVPPRSPGAASGGVLALLDQPRPAAGDRGEGPSVGGSQNAASSRPSDADAMIRGMVDGLAARLERAPNDAEGWVKLIRARKVLGEAQEAEQAFRRAMQVFERAPAEQAKIVAIGQDMGLTK